MSLTYLGTVIGFLTGLVIGFAVRRARLCTFGAIEDVLEGGDFRRLKIFGLALAIAILGTQILVLQGLLLPTASNYLPMRSAVVAIMIGSIMFGLGMSLVGTCSFGSLVRLGGGDLRSFVVILVFATAAFATLRGVVAPLRIGVVEAASFPMPGGNPAGFIEIMEGLWGLPLRLMMALALAAALIFFVAKDRRLWKAKRLLTAGITLGLAVVIGWFTTSNLVDDFESHRAQSLTFVAPVARGVFAAILGGREWLEFGVMSVIGVVVGSFLSATAAREFRWDAFDDQREMKRHLVGAALMGTGGVLAGGCTIGQGLTAGSLLAVSWPIAIAGIVIGSRLGLAFLVEGSLRHVWSDWQQRFSSKRPP
jgi:uncharacterized protein